MDIQFIQHGISLYIKSWHATSPRFTEEIIR